MTIKEIEESLQLANKTRYPIKSKVYCNDVTFLLSRIKELEAELFKIKSNSNTVESIAAKLKEQWRASHPGGCKILSRGDDCQCHLCLVDRLRELAESRAT